MFRTFKNKIASAKLAAQRADWHIMNMITTTNKVTVVGLWYLCFWTSRQILRKSRKNFSFLFKIFKSRPCENFEKSTREFSNGLDFILIFRNNIFLACGQIFESVIQLVQEKDKNIKVFSIIQKKSEHILIIFLPKICNA